MRVARLGMAAALLMAQAATDPIVISAEYTPLRRRPKPDKPEPEEPQFRHAPAPLPLYPSKAERNTFHAAADRRARRNAKRAKHATPTSLALETAR